MLSQVTKEDVQHLWDLHHSKLDMLVGFKIASYRMDLFARRKNHSLSIKGVTDADAKTIILRRHDLQYMTSEGMLWYLTIHTN